MGDTADILKKLALQVRNASSAGENTAERVGRVLSGVLELIDSGVNIEELKKLFLSKTSPDSTPHLLSLLGGAEVEGGLKADSITTLNLLVQELADIYDLDVTHVATMFRTIIKDYVSSETFIPGLMGEGMKIYKALNGDWNLEVDNAVIRKTMTIFELIISKIRAVNGGLVISPANGRIKSVAETTGDPTYYVLGIEGDMEFVADDLVRCQVFTTGQVKYYWVPVASVTADSILVLKSEFANGVTPVPGDDLIQMGNRTNTARQGLLYLTASEDGKPRFSVMDGIDSTSLVGKSKVILGCLDGMTDTDFPADFQPSGYGLYAMNVFLKGVFLLRNGKSVESEIDAAKDAAQDAQDKADAVTRLFQEFTVAGGLFESKITEVKTYADTKVDGLQIGGRNLLRDSKHISISGGISAAYLLTEPLRAGVQYVLSGDVNATGFYVRVYPSQQSAWDEGLTILIGVPFTVSSAMTLLHMYSEPGGSVVDAKLEKGNKPTDWTPAPEDVAADAQNKASAAQAAAELVAIAQAALAKTEASAYADGIVTAEEQRAINDAKAKLEEAKLDATTKADAAKNAAIEDAVGKYNTKSEVSSLISQTKDEINLSVTEKISNVQTQITANASAIEINKQGIALKASQSEVNGLGNRLTSAESSLSVQAGQIAAQVSSVNALTGRVSSAELALQPGNIWLGIKDSVQANIPNCVTQVDTRSLDPNKYYLVTIGMSTTLPYTITVERALDPGYGVPPYCSHGSGFSVICKWQSNGYGWGTIAITRIIQTSAWSFVDTCPVGSIGQIRESSEEYIYVRGGSLYNVRVDGTSSAPVTLRTSTHTPYPDYPSSSRPGIIDSVEHPVPDLDQKVTEEQVKAGIGITPGGITVFGQTISLSGAVTFSSLDGDSQNRITSAQSTANAANGAATDAWNKAEGLKNSLGGLAYDNAVTLAKLDSTIIEGGYIKTTLIEAASITADKIDVINLEVVKLKGATGSFKKLTCVNSSSLEVGAIEFGSDGKMWFSGDMYHQGHNTTENRPHRFYTSDLWCRGEFGHYKMTTVKYSSYSSSDVFFHIYAYGTDTTYHKYSKSGQPIDCIVLSGNANYVTYICDSASEKLLVILNNSDVTKRIKLNGGGSTANIDPWKFRVVITGGISFQAGSRANELYIM